jgi:hypothetical protein
VHLALRVELAGYDFLFVGNDLYHVVQVSRKIVDFAFVDCVPSADRPGSLRCSWLRLRLR